MKKNNLFLLFAAASFIFSCSSELKETTLIVGKFEGEVPQNVHITIPHLVDTVINVENKTFRLEVPTSNIVIGTVSTGNEDVKFIPDGTVLNIKFYGSREVLVKSNTPKMSLTERYIAFNKMIESVGKDLRTKLDAIQADTALKEEEMSEKIADCYDEIGKIFKEFNSKVIEENKNNLLSVLALSNIQYEFNDFQLDSILNKLDSSVLSMPSIIKLKNAIDSRKETVEGKMFKDFTIVQDPASPAKSTVKLSDYVGKGKYVLVDFWASWCRPCKMEIPYLRSIYNSYHGRRFDVVSVSVWDDPKAARDTAKAYGVRWKQIVNAQSIPTEIYGIQGIPQIILFGPDGTIVKRDLRGADIEKEVVKHLSNFPLVTD